MTRAPVPAARLWLLVVGFILWSTGFVSVYAANAIGCAFLWPEPVQRGVLLALFALHLLLLGGFALWARRRLARARPEETRPAYLLDYLGLGTGLAALASTLFVLLPSAVLTLCI